MRKRIRRVPATTSNLTLGIINFLKDKGHYAFPVYNGSVFDPTKKVFRRKSADAPAVSDIMGVLAPSGLFIGIEVKNAATGDKAKSKQKDFAREVKSRGGIHYFAKTYGEFLIWYADNIYDNTDD